MLVIAFILAMVFSLAVTVRIKLLLTVMLFLGHADRSIGVGRFRSAVSPGRRDSVRRNGRRTLGVPTKISMCRVSNPCFFNVTGGFRRVVNHVDGGPGMHVVHVHHIPFVSSANVRGLRILMRRSHGSGVRAILSNIGPRMRSSLVGTKFSGVLPLSGVYPGVGITLRHTTRVAGRWTVREGGRCRDGGFVLNFGDLANSCGLCFRSGAD